MAASFQKAYDALCLRALANGRELIGSGADQLDAIDGAGINAAKMPQGLELGVAQLIHNLLGHIAANPSKQLNTRLLSDSYVYAQLPNAFDDGDEIINNTTTSSQNFVDRLIMAAKNERERTLASDDEKTKTPSIRTIVSANTPGEKFFVVRGSRGAGKTFFLNHLLSRFRQKLDAERVIWVRINLPIARNFDNNIEQWIDAQIAKILLRYYDPRSVLFDKKKSLALDAYEFIQRRISATKDAATRDRLFEQLEYLKSIFMERGEEEDISPTLVPLAICIAIREFCHEQKLGIIVIFDGFDRLDYDSQNADRFYQLRDQLRKYSTSAANSGRVYVCVSRTYTFNDARQTNPFARSRRGAVFVVVPVSVQDIINQRIRSIDDWLSKGATRTDEDAQELRTILSGFKSYLQSTEADWEVDELEKVLGQNNRAKTQAVQFMFIEYLSELRGRYRYKYKLVEFLTTAGKLYPPVFYSYSAGDDRLKAEIAETLDYDSRFLPLLFRQPLLDRKQSSKSIQQDAFFGILHRLRVLQLLYWDWVFDRKLAETAPISIDTLCELLKNYFEYPAEVTRTLVAEMEVFELCLVRRNGSLAEMSGHNGVLLLPKGRHLLEQFVFDVAYLNLNAMRVLFSRAIMPKGLIRVAQRPVGVPPEKRKAAVKDWVLAKLTNSAIMLGLLQAVNAEQAMRVKRIPDAQRHEKYDVVISRMMSQIDEWHRRVSAELSAIENSMRETGILTSNEIASQLHAVGLKLNGSH